MSIEALPNELLVEIFSYLEWSELRDLTLVNRRWNQVIGQRATLTLSKSNHLLDHPAVICIPLGVLYGSSREYSKFCCVLCSTSPKMMSEKGGAFRLAVEYCQQRWNINTLRIVARYYHFMLFLQHHKHLLNEVVWLDISVHDCVYNTFGSSFPVGTHSVLPMGKLQQLDLHYETQLRCFLKLYAPNLECFKVDRCLIRSKVHLTFHDSSKLRSVLISNINYTHVLSSDPDPVELESILPQAPSRLEIIGCSIATTFSGMFGNLQTIILKSVTLTPTDDPLECLNLTKLELSDVTLEKPLKLRVPKLNTLICNIKTLQSVYLQDAFKADLLAIDMFCEDSVDRVTLPVDLSSFRTLHLLLWHNQRLDDSATDWLWPCLSGITELKLQSNPERIHWPLPANIWEHFPRLYSLRLLGTHIPDNLKFLPATVEAVTIEECSTNGRSIEFPPSVKRVQINKMWKETEDASNDGMILLPPNRYPPIQSAIVPVKHNSQMLSKMTYSTKDCHDMESFNRLPQRERLINRLLRVV